MKFLYKELSKEMLKNKVYLVLLIIFSCFSSVIFFYCHFSIDGNLEKLNSLPTLTINQENYKTALLSNEILARNFFIISIVVTSFVFIMYFYRYFKSSRKQIGCLKSLGFKDSSISGYFVGGATILGLLGTILALIVGYFTSDILIEANKKATLVEDIFKSISITNIFIGLLVPCVVFSIVVFLLYKIVIWGKEAGSFLVEARDNHKNSIFFSLSEKILNLLPIKKKFPLRIVLRNPIGILILFLAVIIFQGFFILGSVLPLSSEIVYDSQLKGHNYNFESNFIEYKNQVRLEDDVIYGVNVPCSIIKDNKKVDFPMNISGLEYNPKIFSLTTKENETLQEPKDKEIIIDEAQKNMFGYKTGERIILLINGESHDFIISGIAENAKTNTVYINKTELSKILKLSSSKYNKAFSLNDLGYGDETISREAKLEELKRGMVSNDNSSTINKVIGFLSGTFLMFLALYIIFQNNTRDILILSLIGYKSKSIRKMLIDIYFPILIIISLIGIVPSIFIAKSIVMSLSFQTKDYMPFIMSPFKVVICFIYTIIIYFSVQILFYVRINKIVKKEEFNREV